MRPSVASIMVTLLTVAGGGSSSPYSSYTSYSVTNTTSSSPKHHLQSTPTFFFRDGLPTTYPSLSLLVNIGVGVRFETIASSGGKYRVGVEVGAVGAGRVGVVRSVKEGLCPYLGRRRGRGACRGRTICMSGGIPLMIHPPSYRLHPLTIRHNDNKEFVVPSLRLCRRRRSCPRTAQHALPGQRTDYDHDFGRWREQVQPFLINSRVFVAVVVVVFSFEGGLSSTVTSASHGSTDH